MKIYIAGKIAGDPDYRVKFAEIQKAVQRHGCTALNPATLPDGMSPADYMRICFAMLDSADLALFLPDWKSSNGALLEMQYCRYIGKPVRMVREDDNAAAPAADSVTVQRWIPVEERLPAADGAYLICNDRGAVYTCFFHVEKNFQSGYARKAAWFQMERTKVTHWMPLPEAPKMKEK